MGEDKQKVVDTFKKLSEVANDVAVAYENEDEKEMESAMGRFLFLCMEMQEMK